MTDYTNFRQRLDAVLRTFDVKQVTGFLIAEKQWQAGQPADPEFAMWMMIAGSPTLRDLHEQAYQWLVSHGHEEEANAVLRREKGTGGIHSKKNRQQEKGKPIRYQKQNGDTRLEQHSGLPKKAQGSPARKSNRPHPH
ncbi:MAG: hypothetical protein NVS3B14_09800 [Ktedonobacteraceae bacterium]